MYLIVLGDESVLTSKIGYSDTVALIYHIYPWVCSVYNKSHKHDYHLPTNTHLSLTKHHKYGQCDDKCTSKTHDIWWKQIWVEYKAPKSDIKVYLDPCVRAICILDPKWPLYQLQIQWAIVVPKYGKWVFMRLASCQHHNLYCSLLKDYECAFYKKFNFLLPICSSTCVFSSM